MTMTVTLEIPGWVVAIPALIYLLTAYLCIQRYVRSERARLPWMIVGVVPIGLYYLALMPFVIHGDRHAPLPTGWVAMEDGIPA